MHILFQYTFWILSVCRLSMCNPSLLLFLDVKKLYLLRIECRPRSRDLTTPYIQYVKRTMPTIISIKLNMAERNVNRIAPNTSIAIAMTRIQRSGFDALEFMSRPPRIAAAAVVSASSSGIVIAVSINVVTVQIH